jgi:adenylate cyclase
MLVRIPGFIVIARQSSFVYQGRSVDARQIGRELGVRYIVEGSLRPVDQQIASRAADRRDEWDTALGRPI